MAAYVKFQQFVEDLTLNDGESLTIDFESDGPTTGSLLTLA